MLTWLDTLKLLVAIAVPFALLFVSTWYTHRTERIAKQRSLWRALDADTASLPELLTVLTQQSAQLDSGKVKLLPVDFPAFLISFAGRLAELDPKNAFLYSDFTAHIDIVLKDVDNLSQLFRIYLSSPDPMRDNIRETIKYQITALKHDIVRVGKRNVEVLNAIQRSCGGEHEVVVRAKNAVERCEELLKQ